MLKRLLSRDISSKVASRAKSALAPNDVSSLDDEDLIVPTVHTKPTPIARRQTKSMRASDVIDEHGRSAEQLAAEAALEFDIMAVARRVNGEDSAETDSSAVAEPGPAPIAVPAVEPSPTQTHAELPTPPAAAQVAVPTQQLASTTPAPDPAIAPKPVARNAPVPSPLAPAPTPPAAKAPSAGFPTVAYHAPKSVPSGLEIENGHIFHPGADHGAAEKSLIARNAYWNQLGRTAPEPLGYDISPEIKGAPAWPTVEQRFRIVRTTNTLIIATEGLSDPFGAFRGPSDANGYGMELFIEVPGMQATSPDAIRTSWAFRAVEHTAILCAHAKGLSELLETNGVMSLDLSRHCVPSGWIVPGHVEPAGALLGVPMPPGRDIIKNMPLSKTRVIPLTLIFPEELEDCLVSGANERRALVNDLLTTGQGHKSDPKRNSLR